MTYEDAANNVTIGNTHKKPLGRGTAYVYFSATSTALMVGLSYEF